MKRMLVLLPLMGAASLSHAQSFVTLQGTVDLGIAHVKGSESSRTQMVSGSNTTSKLIFRGQEDLGNGMYAMFWLEAGFNADTGMGHTSNLNNQPSGNTVASGLIFNRRSIVGLGGRWGEIRLGREHTPNYEFYTPKYDPFGLGTGVALNYIGSISPNQIRASNDIAYISPQFLSGFSVNVQHWRGENLGGTATSNDGNGGGAKLNYDNGPFSAAAAFLRTKYAAGDATYRSIAGAYDFGLARVSFIGTNNHQGTLKESGWLVGVTVPVGATQLKATYSTLGVDRPGDPEGKKLALGAVYNFSKRTALYSTVAMIRNSGGATYALSGITTAANRSSSGIEFGLRHNF